MIRLTHVLIGSFILASFFVMSICGYYIIKGRHVEAAKRSFRIALVFGAVSALAQLVAGHFSAVVVAEHQPAKLAALEGVYDTTDNAGLTIIGWVDDENEKTYALEMPGMLSWMLRLEGIDEVKGLTEWAREDRPPVQITFQTYHMMVGLGMYFIGITLFALFLMWRGKLFEQKWLMWIFVFSVVLPYIANQAGWVAAEVGRQHCIVYGRLGKAQAFS